MTTDLLNPPSDLHPLQYGRVILEEVLGWPAAKGNLELISDCIVALQKSRNLTAVRAYRYLLRAIGLAKEQGFPCDRFFFLEGRYTEMRPTKEEGLPFYKPIDWKAVEREQSTEEWQAMNAELRAALAKLAGRAMP
jgi:hypothetical protein